MSLSLTIELVLYANLVRSIRVDSAYTVDGQGLHAPVLCSSLVEHTTHNRGVAGSNPV